jgi:hypothetical protein
MDGFGKVGGPDLSRNVAPDRKLLARFP